MLLKVKRKKKFHGLRKMSLKVKKNPLKLSQRKPLSLVRLLLTGIFNYSPLIVIYAILEAPMNYKKLFSFKIILL